MRRLYLTITGPTLSARLVDELLAAGLPAHSIQLYAQQPKRLGELHLPVSVAGFRPPLDRVALRALTGAIIALMGMLLAIAFGGAGPQTEVLLVVTLAGAAVGAATALMPGYPSELRRLRGELRREDVVMVVDVPDARLGELEQGIKTRHPEIRVKGTDPGGSPPFP